MNIKHYHITVILGDVSQAFLHASMGEHDRVCIVMPDEVKGLMLKIYDKLVEVLAHIGC